MEYNRKYERNEKVFLSIKTEEQSYWLGFFSADGCLKNDGSVQLVLSIKDIKHLQCFKDFIGYTGPIKIRKVTLGKTLNKSGLKKCYKAADLRIYSKPIYESLKQFGIKPRKSLIFCYPNNIPDHLINHFIRGYIDGDGSWVNVKRKYPTIKLTICGTKQFLKTISKIFVIKCNARPGSISHPSKIYSLAYNGNDNIRKIAGFLYKDSTICLQRKKQKLMDGNVLNKNNEIIPGRYNRRDGIKW